MNWLNDATKMDETCSRKHHLRNVLAEKKAHILHKKFIERIDIILDTHSAQYIRHLFAHVQFLDINLHNIDNSPWAKTQISTYRYHLGGKNLVMFFM